MTRELHCSFCGKSEHRVEKLVGGPGVYICDTCVGIASRIIAEDGTAPPQAPYWRRTVNAARGLLERLRHWSARASSTLEQRGTA